MIRCMDTILCTKCETVPATRFLGASDPYDPLCESCYAEDFRQCFTCGAWHLKENVWQRRVAVSPDEYDDVCISCAKPGRDDHD